MASRSVEHWERGAVLEQGRIRRVPHKLRYSVAVVTPILVTHAGTPRVGARATVFEKGGGGGGGSSLSLKVEVDDTRACMRK